ncbi:hypothetical protein DKM44_05940 [Deinococcus irradiatisoli]|uniref:Lipoprotein n=1 Tax=Deinococcus irradiatisoli TaxID=2202254 RepID=A0A2Z3JCR0_9DEIO|nr:hypothetical protein [Deinococcus irradiatisoli]AWN22822.1 hypothetical protein DKM44_05940 [Deinococcus irradiatisoli]
MLTLRFKRSRIPLSVWVLLLLAGCSWGRDHRSAQATEQAVIDAARETMALAAGVIGGSEFKAGARWYICSGGIGQHYDGGGIMKAPKGDVSLQLEAIRSAVVGAGFTDITQVKGMVTVKRDDIILNLNYRQFDKVWRISFRSHCYTYPRTDKKWVESSVYKELKSLTP